ncbi:MAG: adenylate/guanylate cyclase domain-containing protein [Gammaproteobacteria bacterium]|nr:adenylate/guanylate cyclase domain-containing protein [Gammaproteobacteria bacterium]
MERQSRTWLCSVVFLDIAGYTEKPVEQQIEMKEHLQKLVADAVSNIAETERIMVDTGDGAALCFLGDPEEAMFVALNLRDLLTEKETATPFKIRIGINLGPVKVIKSISGQLNPLGDGINNAQRVMSFAEPNQILISRSFYDVIACLSEEYAQVFRYLGTRKDKHGKQHPVYEVVLSEGEQTYATVATVKASAENVQVGSNAPLPAPAITWDPALLKTAEDDLAIYIGPLAKVLVGRAALQATSAQDLYTVLGNMIPVDDARTKFLAKAPASEPVVGRAEDSISMGPDSGPTTDGLSTTGSTWDPTILKTAEQELAMHLGPLSRVIVKKAAKKTSSLKELYELLACELPTEAAQNAFLSKHRSSKKL